MVNLVKLQHPYIVLLFGWIIGVWDVTKRQVNSISPEMMVYTLYYTIIDFNEVDIRIYLPEKVIIHRGR